jgi:hypothetical protein
MKRTRTPGPGGDVGYPGGAKAIDSHQLLEVGPWPVTGDFGCSSGVDVDDGGQLGLVRGVEVDLAVTAACPRRFRRTGFGQR